MATTVAVLGGYGLIGSACVRALRSAGYRVIGVGRSLATGRSSEPDIEWLERDVAATTAATWRRDLAGVDVVVNAAGALQDGLRDNLRGVHEDAIANLAQALSGSTVRFIQISAAGVSESAATEFMRSKWRGDRLLMASDLDWVILRPTLVLGPDAYGGTALLRATAAMPAVELRALPHAAVQTVDVEDVAHAVTRAAAGGIASATAADLTEPQGHELQDVVRRLRRWQGFPPWRRSIRVPSGLLHGVARVADGLGWLGWRSPLRSTAIQSLTAGVSGTPNAWERAGGAPCRTLEETLQRLPSTVQERWFARMFLVLPLAVATLSLFWIASGVIGLAHLETAKAELTGQGVSMPAATFAVLAGSVVDIFVGAAILVRRWTRAAAGAMIAIASGYLAAAAVVTPELWSDPLGPMLKVFPGIVLAAIVAALPAGR